MFLFPEIDQEWFTIGSPKDILELFTCENTFVKEKRQKGKRKIINFLLNKHIKQKYV
jgi:hypothetical protein